MSTSKFKRNVPEPFATQIDKLTKAQDILYDINDLKLKEWDELTALCEQIESLKVRLAYQATKPTRKK